MDEGGRVLLLSHCEYYYLTTPTNILYLTHYFFRYTNMECSYSQIYTSWDSRVTPPSWPSRCKMVAPYKVGGGARDLSDDVYVMMSLLRMRSKK
jgi:hypothetical protein